MKITFNKNLPEDFSLENIYGVIYLITNLINSKIYVGQTTNVFNRLNNYNNLRCKGQKYLYSALLKYGIENFTFEILDISKDLDTLNFLENFYIKTLESNNRAIGYNIREGGKSGGKCAKETKDLLSKVMTGEGNPNFGKHKTLEQKNKTSITMSGKKYSPERCANMSKSKKGCIPWNKGKKKAYASA